jgi:Proteasome subunit
MRILTSINSTRLVLVWMGLFSAAIGLPEKAAATTIVVIRTPSEVVIAADSFATIRADAGSSSTESVCKIYQLNSKLFFAVSGLVNDGLTGFSIPDVVASASRIGDGVSAKMDEAERRVRAAVLRELPRVKERDPAGYAKLIHAKGAVTVMFAGIDAGIPAAASFSLGLELSSTGFIEVNVIHDSCPANCPSGTRAFWFGEGAVIERLRATGGLPSLPMPELARYLVQAEIDAGAPSAGGPVDVLRILPGGPVWLRKKQSCPAALPTGAK